jgi:hypothetical protein
MTFQPSGKSREETRTGGPRDGASAELEATSSFIKHASFYWKPSVAYFNETRTILKVHECHIRWRVEGRNEKPPESREQRRSDFGGVSGRRQSPSGNVKDTRTR